MKAELLSLSQVIGEFKEWRASQEKQSRIFTCRQDRRRKVCDQETIQLGTINRYVRRRIKDIPLFGAIILSRLNLQRYD